MVKDLVHEYRVRRGHGRAVVCWVGLQGVHPIDDAVSATAIHYTNAKNMCLVSKVHKMCVTRVKASESCRRDERPMQTI